MASTSKVLVSKGTGFLAKVTCACPWCGVLGTSEVKDVCPTEEAVFSLSANAALMSRNYRSQFSYDLHLLPSSPSMARRGSNESTAS